MTVWLNGEFIEEGARIDVADRGFLLGDGVFETIYVEDGAPAFIDAHITRLNRGLDSLGIEYSLEAPRVSALVAELAECNGLSNGCAAARLTVSRGPGGRGLAAPSADASRPTRLLTLTRYSRPTEPLQLIVSAQRRYSRSITSRCKTLNYADNILARAEAARAGADEALMLNEYGRVACASAANIFLLGADGVVATPPVEEGALPGVTRAALISVMAQDGLVIAERPIAPEELKEGGLLITNSLIGVTAATMADGCPARKAQVRQRLQLCYARALAEDLAATRGAQ